jgi:hypothetical protein
LNPASLRIMMVCFSFIWRYSVTGMDCQICLRGLEPLEPVYRMQFGHAINNGWRTSLCSRCLGAFVEALKWSSLKDAFRPSEPCEVCRRPVFNFKRWKATRVICSWKCRGTIDTRAAKKLRTSRRLDRTCPHCAKEFKPNHGNRRYCSAACKQAAYRQRIESFQLLA